MPPPDTVPPSVKSLEATIADVGTQIAKASGSQIEHDDGRLYTQRAVVVRAASAAFAGCYVQTYAMNPQASSMADPNFIIDACEAFAKALLDQGYLPA